MPPTPLPSATSGPTLTAWLRPATATPLPPAAPLARHTGLLGHAPPWAKTVAVGVLFAGIVAVLAAAYYRRKLAAWRARLNAYLLARKLATEKAPEESNDTPLPRDPHLLLDGEAPVDEAASGRAPQPGPSRPDGSYTPHGLRDGYAPAQPIGLAAWKQTDYQGVAAYHAAVQADEAFDAEAEVGEVEKKGFPPAQHLAANAEESLDAWTIRVHSACAAGDVTACFQSAEGWITTGQMAADRWNSRPLSYWYPLPLMLVSKSMSPPAMPLISGDVLTEAMQESVQAMTHMVTIYDPHHPDAEKNLEAVRLVNSTLDALSQRMEKACAVGDMNACFQAAEDWRTAGDMASLRWGSMMPSSTLHIPPEAQHDYAVVSISTTLIDEFSIGGSLIRDRCDETYLCVQLGKGASYPSWGSVYVSSGDFSKNVSSCKDMQKLLSGWSLYVEAGAGVGGTIVQPVNHWEELLSLDFSSPRALEIGLYTPQIEGGVSRCWLLP